MVSAALRQAFTQLDHQNASQTLRHVVDQFRADVVGILPNEGAIIRLIGAVLLEANHEWQLQHRTTQTEAMAELTPPTIDVVLTQITSAAK